MPPSESSVIGNARNFKFLVYLLIVVTITQRATCGGGYGPPLPPGGGGGGGFGGGGGGFGGSGGSFPGGDLVTLQLQSMGAIRGRRFLSAPRPPLGIRRPFLAFRGIPYAKPPSGMYRFREPRPYGSWGGTLEATEFKRPCPQVDPVTGSHIGDEDCLYLNVFVPEVVFGGSSFGQYPDPFGGIPLPLEPPIGFPPYRGASNGGQGNNNNKKGLLRPFLGGIPKKRGKSVPFDPFREADDLDYPHNIQEILRNFDRISDQDQTVKVEDKQHQEPPRRRTGKVRFPRSTQTEKPEESSPITTATTPPTHLNATSAEEVQSRSSIVQNSSTNEAELVNLNHSTNASLDDSYMVAEARAPPLSPGGGGIGGLGAPGGFFPNPRPNTLLPVMVFIHGPGAFVAGSSQQFGPQPLMRHDVILVTFDYRLGVLGFLSTNDRENGGNWGLLDQIEALKWVKQNVAAFGGDPQRITVFGHQAGAASAHILMLSPRARGLFDQIILQSGSSICDWAIENRPFDYARRIGQEVHCRDPWESDDLMDCLEDAPITRILDAQEELMKYGYLPYRAAPVVDKGCRDDPVLPDDPYQLLINGQFNRMPMIVGTTQDEGLLQFLMTYLDAGEEARSPEHLRTRVLPWLIRYMMKDDRELDIICDTIFEQYFNQTNFGDQDSIIRSFSNMITDAMFESCKQETLRLHAKNGGETKIYSYVFSYRDYGTPSFSDKYIREAQGKGLNSALLYTATSGGDDLLYLFNYIHAHNLNFGFGSQLDEIVLPPLPSIHASIDIISNTLTTYWTKFAEQGRLGYIGPIMNGQIHLNWPSVDESGNGNLNLTIQNYPMLSEYKPMVASYWYRTLPLVRHFGHKIWRGEAFEIVAWVFVALFLLLLIIVIALAIVLCCMRRKRMYKQPLRKTTLAKLREPSSE